MVEYKIPHELDEGENYMIISNDEKKEVWPNLTPFYNKEHPTN